MGISEHGLCVGTPLAIYTTNGGRAERSERKKEELRRGGPRQECRDILYTHAPPLMARRRYMKREAVLCGRGRKGAIHISGSVRRGSPSGGEGKASLPSGGLQNPSLHVNKIPGQKQKEHDSEKRPLSMIFTVYHPPCSPFPSLRFFIGQQKIHKLQEKFPTVVEGGRGGEGSREGERQMGMRRARWRRRSAALGRGANEKSKATEPVAAAAELKPIM